jgi:hypothetical protein
VTGNGPQLTNETNVELFDLPTMTLLCCAF